MNIFVVDIDPISAAKQLPDKHVTKMIVESAQMLSIVYSKHYWDAGVVTRLDGEPFKTEKGAFKKHPCTMWAASSTPNCAWLIQHACGLLGEYRLRYEKVHGLSKSIFDAKKLFHRFTKKTILDYLWVDEFVFAGPDEFKLDKTLTITEKYQRYVSSKPWVWENYKRMPHRKPQWITPPKNLTFA